MLISLRSDGTAVMLLPSHVYQGSNVANVFVTAPFPNTTSLQVGFTLPNGTTVSAPMTYVQDSENNLIVWQYTIAAAITNEAGAASVSITATTQTGQVIASQSIPFTIEATTLPVLPDTPSQDEYTLILQYIQQNSANIATIQGQISTIEEDVATANSNASEALSTANQAASAAASNATAIANIVNGTTTVAKADSANSATNATNATNDGNGANIANTYATKTELSTGNADTLAAAQNYTNQALSNYSIIEIVQTLPETGDTGKIYLVPKADSTSSDLYSEYLWNGSAWELVGTVDATSGTTIKVNGVSQIEVDFDSDPQTQITANATAISNIVNGTTPAGKATADGNGNNIVNTYATQTGTYSGMTVGNATNASQLGGVAAANYAQLSQVVRTDIVSSNSDEQKRIASENTLRYITGSPNNTGWYRVAQLSGAGVYEINISSTYSVNPATAIKFIIAVSTATGYNTSITQIGGAPNLTVVTQARLNQDSGNLYFEIYVANPNNPIGVSYKAVTSLGNGLSVSNITPVAFTNITNPNNVIATISVVCGITTTGGVYANGAPVLAVDPTTLTPSTANGWSIGDATTQLADGVYKVYPITSGYVQYVMDLTMANGSGVASVSIGYSGNNNTAVIVVESLTFENQVLSAAKWVSTEINSPNTFATSYYYKKLA